MEFLRDLGELIPFWAVLLILAAIVFGPMITIWALNTVFGLGIELSWSTWFAVAWLGAVVGGAGNSNGSKS